MVFLKVPDFLGPVTPIELTTWLKECESVYDQEHQKRKFGDLNCSEKKKFWSDVTKIKAAGSALLEPNLAKWWKAERFDFLEEGATWDDFVDALKGKALGRLWKAHALKTVYTLQQNDASLDDYLAAMADARYVLHHGGVIIDDDQYKSLLLFRASPSLSEKVFAEQGFDLIKACPKDIRTKLRHVADSSSLLSTSRNGTVDLGSEQTDFDSDSTVAALDTGDVSSLELLTSSAYGDLDNRFTQDFFDLDSRYLADTKSLGPVRGVALCVNNRRWIIGYKITFDENHDPLEHPVDRHPRLPFAYCSLDPDDYINSLTLTWEVHKTGWPSSIKFGTSKGKSCVGGAEFETQVTLKSPKGWRIVGLHGSAEDLKDGSQVLCKVGAIYAPIQIGIHY